VVVNCYCCEHGEEETQAHIAEMVASMGFAIMTVPGQVPFHYTIGLWDQGLPEFVIMGLSPRQGHVMLNMLVLFSLNEGMPALNTPFDDISTMPSMLVEVDEIFREEIFGSAMRHTDNHGRIVQMLWPDKEGRFPGDPEFALEYLIRQPLLVC
jgi:hypothetical protein